MSIFETEYLNNYLRMVEETESPRVFHLWSAIWAASTSLGRRCWLPFGISDWYPNQFIVLVGSPASRKSTALNIARKLVKQATGARFAPADTGGQRQGLVLAMQGSEADHAKEYLGAAELSGRENSISSLTQLEEVTNVPQTEQQIAVADADKHHLTVSAGEFSRFIGQNNHSMLDFLQERYDGDDYEYKTLKSNITLKGTLMNLIAATTPTSLNAALPPAANGQGFLSRIILVYGAQKYKSIARPVAPPVEFVNQIKGVLAEIYHQAHGMVEETQEAHSFSETLYGYGVDITDSRFAYYAERRFTHLIKLAITLAATRITPGKAVELCKCDYEEAHRILRATERGMPDALGEFGMNPMAVLKQEILEQMRASQGPLTLSQVIAMFHRDASSRDISETINDLIRIGQIRMNQLGSGQRVLSAVYSKQDTEDSMMKLLANKE